LTWLDFEFYFLPPPFNILELIALHSFVRIKFDEFSILLFRFQIKFPFSSMTVFVRMCFVCVCVCSNSPSLFCADKRFLGENGMQHNLWVVGATGWECKKNITALKEKNVSQRQEQILKFVTSPGARETSYFHIHQNVVNEEICKWNAASPIKIISVNARWFTFFTVLHNTYPTWRFLILLGLWHTIVWCIVLKVDEI
jgi:hypothetical protein